MSLSISISKTYRRPAISAPPSLSPSGIYVSPESNADQTSLCFPPPQLVPVPTLLGILMSVNFGEEYIRAAGPAALPQEFYLKPAHVHLDEWCVGVGE